MNTFKNGTPFCSSFQNQYDGIIDTGQRYFDLKRWHIAHLVVPKLAIPEGVPLVFQEKHYLLPFPQSEMDINPALVQNPGY